MDLDLAAAQVSARPVLAAAQSADVAHRIRGDIEGLRALAVASVLIHHAFPPVLAGGFAGVDIFFVISGYLIGRHLLEDFRAGRFSIPAFYAKRARRLFPALLVVLICVLTVGWFVFTAPEFEALGAQVAAATAFSNNVLLWSQTGYFDVAAVEKPLLHLWSLGIEEQFYLVVPGLLWLSSRRGTGSIRWVARLAGLSLLATIFLSDFEYSASFYLLHTRFWELASGVLLAQTEMRVQWGAAAVHAAAPASKRDLREIYLFSIAAVFVGILQIGTRDTRTDSSGFLANTGPLLVIVFGACTGLLADTYSRPERWARLRTWARRHARQLATVSSSAGLALVCASIVCLGSANWPGPQTLFPVVGTLLLIAGGPLSAPNRVLALAPLVFIGGLSYPLYLWHWPMIVVWNQWFPKSGPLDMAIVLVAALVLAWLTKLLIEDPIRFGKSAPAKIKTLRPVVWALALTGVLGLSIVVADGLPSRFSPTLRAIATWSEPDPDAPWRIQRCYFYTLNPAPLAAECTPQRRAGVPQILLWGDSHAAQLYPGLAHFQSLKRFDIIQWTAAGCPPTVKKMTLESSSCPQRRATALSGLPGLDPDVAVLAGAWARYHELGISQSDILGLVADTIHYLRSLGVGRIVIFGPGPIWNSSEPIDTFRFMARTHAARIPDRLGKVGDDLWALDAAMRAQAAAEHVRYVSVLGDFCDLSGCLTVNDASLARPDFMFRDRDHLTVSGSRFLIEKSMTQLFD